MTESQLFKDKKNNDFISSREDHGISGTRQDVRTYNNNNDEPKYLHKKFKKMASKEILETFDSTGKCSSENSVRPAKFSEKETPPSLDKQLKNLNECTQLPDYVCSFCKIVPTQSSISQKHSENHSIEKPSSRVPCRFSFKTNYNLCRHCRLRTYVIEVNSADTVKLPSDLDIDTSSCFSSNSGTQPSIIEKPTANNSCYVNTRSNINSDFRSYSTCNTYPSMYTSYFDNTNGILNTNKIYKPKFHTFLKQCKANKLTKNQTTSKYFQNHARGVVVNKNIFSINDTYQQKLSRRHQSLEPEIKNTDTYSKMPPRKRSYSENTHESTSYSNHPFLKKSNAKDKKTRCPLEFNIQSGLTLQDLEKSQELNKIETNSKSFINKEEDSSETSQLTASPGPLLGTTQLVDSQTFPFNVKRTRYESSVDIPMKYSQPKALQLFGGEVCIFDSTRERKIVSMEPSLNCSLKSIVTSNIVRSMNSETSVVVRSGLHSGGTILHKNKKKFDVNSEDKSTPINVSVGRIVPNIVPPTLAPIVSCFGYLNPSKILHEGQLIPYVPGIPGPHNLSAPVELQGSVVSASRSGEFFSFKSNHEIPIDYIKISDVSNSSSLLLKNQNSIKNEMASNKMDNKFVRPSSLSLKPGTFIPKQHHGITPTANTLALISPETPRSKKSYGQLFLNGHAYTYLGLKCSTRLFYCTINRPQPMYVLQQHNLSMYSNWKICEDKLSEYQLADYDSRQRSTIFTLACSRQNDILTHSSQNQRVVNNCNSNFIEDFQEKNKRIKIFDGGFESNEDYTYIRGRGRGRYVCEECGIRCKKPSMLKKHIRTHTDVRPFTCKNCSFSFKTKGNLTKHMKSKSHYKKCTDLKIYPVPTRVCDDNIDKEVLNRLKVSGATTDETSSDEEDSEIEIDESDESGCEEQEAAESLLSLSQFNLQKLPGLLPLTRPSTYPYCMNSLVVNNHIKSKETSNNTVKQIGSTVSSRVELENQTFYDLTHQPKLLFSHKNSFAAGASLNSHNISLESRLSVISSCKTEETTPIDLTTSSQKPALIVEPNFGDSVSMLENVTGSAFISTIVQTIESLPYLDEVDQELKAQNSAQELMLQAYITERHVMDRKLKQQYYILPNDNEKKEEFSTSTHHKKNPVPKPALSLQNNCQNFNQQHLQKVLFQKCNTNSMDQEIIQQTSEPIIHLVKAPHELRNALSKISKSELHDSVSLKKFRLDQIEVPGLTKQSISSKIDDQKNYLSVSAQNDAHSAKFSVEHLHPPHAAGSNFPSLLNDGRSVCSICNKVFSKPSQLRLHINIHYFERPFRCESCGTSFRTKGHLTKHERSTLHHNKVNMTSAFGTATASNPRPFKCVDCKSAFRIHGHLAKHLRSKMHIMKLECLHKLPFGTYAEMERSGVNFNEIDTTDCKSSLNSLQIMVQKLSEKEPSKLGHWEIGETPNLPPSSGDTSSDEAEANFEEVSQLPESHASKKFSVLISSDSAMPDLDNVKTDEIENVQSFQCHKCFKSVKSTNELHIHYFLEHNLQPQTVVGTRSLNSEKVDLEKNRSSDSIKGERCTNKERDSINMR